MIDYGYYDIIILKKKTHQTSMDSPLNMVCFPLPEGQPPILRMGLWPGARKDGDKVPGGLATTATTGWAFSWDMAVANSMVDGRYTLWLFNIAMESGPFIEDLWWFTYPKWWFSIATLNNQTVTIDNYSFHGVYKSTTMTGGHHPVWIRGNNG